MLLPACQQGIDCMVSIADSLSADKAKAFEGGSGAGVKGNALNAVTI